ncbi:Dabb family protein [Kineococcus glutinatus]|uniref:Stress-response A/B barrel domain-containing protein n=1 Tax=Kineococcus glutinatus TaxID=1070872 RepID=A0ABP9HUD4_9ACTN
MIESLREQLAAVGAAAFTARDHRPGLVRHIVLFRYRQEVTEAQKAEVLRRFLALADSRRADGERYITSVEAGGQGSGEGAGGGYEHGVVVTFASEGDRNHYVGAPVVEDPAYCDAEHAAFKEFVGPLLHPDGGALVFDVVGHGAGPSAPR